MSTSIVFPFIFPLKKLDSTNSKKNKIIKDKMINGNTISRENSTIYVFSVFLHKSKIVNPCS